MQEVLVSISILIFLFFSQKQHTTKVIEQHRKKTTDMGYTNSKSAKPSHSDERKGHLFNLSLFSRS